MPNIAYNSSLWDIYLLTKKIFLHNLSTFGKKFALVTLNALPKCKVEIIIQDHALFFQQTDWYRDRADIQSKSDSSQMCDT